MAFNISFFSSLSDTRPDLRVGLEWPDLVATIGPPRPALTKESMPLFSPCEWVAGHGPSKEEGTKYVVGVHFGVFDFDDTPDIEVPMLTAGLEAAGIAYVLVSSFSHNGRSKKTGAPGFSQLRVIFPFSRMVQVSEWKTFWENANQRIFGGRADKVCKSPGHRYYVPCYREGAGVQPIYVA